MELLNCNPEWRDEARRVFAAHANDRRYPKHLTVPELIAQVEALRHYELTDLAFQIGGGGKLKSQFLNYIRQCSCACWSSWRAAWKDFAVFMEFTEPKDIPQPATDKEPDQFDGVWR